MQGKGSSPNATHKRAKTFQKRSKRKQKDTLKQASGCIRSNILQTCSECSYFFSINTVFVCICRYLLGLDVSGIVWICGLNSIFE